MRYEIVHTTTYRYSRPVFVEPQIVRLRPRTDAAQRLDAFALTVDPEPDGVSEGLDAWNNDVAWTWFSGEIERLVLRTEVVVETMRPDPFDYIVLPPDADRVGRPAEPELAPFLGAGEPAAELCALAERTRDAAGGGLVAFCGALADTLYREHEIVVRPEGEAWAPERTLAEGRGSCRDLSVLYVACCRALGVPARFVSGYQEGDPGGGERDLHAWAEVYIPGGGWRGYDPTHGLAVADGHVAVAAAPEPAGAAPMSGSFRGTGASATMEATVTIRPAGNRRDDGER